ncbi:MAG TPA: rhamnulokinase [Firmicutes bacterium]|jgi:rhamnulokinase|nr:rhamnulokinase [Bacillota bacterium]
MNCIAFDLGGSGGKLFLCHFDGEHLSLKDVHRFDNNPLSLNNGLYWNILNIYSHLNTGVKKAMQLADQPIVSLGLDSFSNDFAFIDQSGELLTQLRCYRDQRTEKHKAAIYAKMSPERLYSLSGNQIALFNTLMQLAAMQESGQGYILKNAHKMLFAPDLLINFLTGETASEYTIASVSQMFDFSKNTWNDEIIRAYDIPPNIFCDIVTPGTIIGKTKNSYNKELDITGFNVVSVCEHDTASAFLSSMSKGDHIIISSGTWSLVGTEVNAPIINPMSYRYNIANEGGFRGRHRLLRNVMGLWIIQELRNYYNSHGQQYSFADMEEAATQAKPFAHRIDPDDLIFFSPEDMPLKISQKCMEFDGKSPQNMGETVRCAVESLAFKYRWSIEKIEQLIGKSLPIINIIGGGSKDRLLCQFTANACNKSVLAGLSDATALGNILVQLLANRQISSLEQGQDLIRQSFPIAEYLPCETPVWEEKYQEFKATFHLD